MSSQKLKSVHVIGIAVRTSNLQGKADKDIPALWQTFLETSVADKLLNRVGNETYCVYTEYESDHNAPYTVLIGCPVSNLDTVPEGMKGIVIREGDYEKFVAKGNIMQGAIWQEWQNIWQSNIERTYHTDYEVYDERSENPQDAEVDIFVGVL